MNAITRDTRSESHNSVEKQARYEQIENVLKESLLGYTAKEIAVELYNNNVIPTTERNFTAPRLTELEERGIVKVIGKKKCTYTNRMVAIYVLVNEND